MLTAVSVMADDVGCRVYRMKRINNRPRGGDKGGRGGGVGVYSNRI